MLRRSYRVAREHIADDFVGITPGGRSKRRPYERKMQIPSRGSGQALGFTHGRLADNSFRMTK
jgi:hypothetical protein